MGRKPPWNSTVHDLSVHRSSPREIEQRKARYTSPNAEVAREEVARRRERLARGNFEDTLAALAGRRGEDEHDETKTALQELDRVSWPID